MLVEADQARFDRLRQAHFPSHLNHIAAHVTLFHHLPGAEHEAVHHALTQLGASTPPCTAAVTGLRSLGRGVAFTLECPQLAATRATLARSFHDQLTAQDRQGFRPHVTIQNKVTPQQATALLASMQAGFVPFTVAVEGLALWRYEGGPWSPAGNFPFTYTRSTVAPLAKSGGFGQTEA